MKQAKRPAEGEGKMTEIAPDFDAFIHAWAATRIGPLGDRTDPSDREFMIKRRAAELESLAKEAALYSALHNATRPYGGVAGYVRSLYEIAEANAKRK
jgi:hypothetical protein